MFAVVMFVGIQQVSENEERMHEESLSHLNLNKQIVSQQLNDLYISLEAVAPVLVFEEGYTQDQMLRSMTAVRDACGFDFVVRTNTDGIAFNYLGKSNINIANRQYIHDALQGHRACEYVAVGAYDPGSAYVILAVPIFYRGAVVGVLHGSYKISNVNAMLSKLAVDEHSYNNGTFIFTTDGTLIATSNPEAEAKYIRGVAFQWCRYQQYDGIGYGRQSDCRSERLCEIGCKRATTI